MSIRLLGVIAVCLFASGCAKRYCEREQPYQTAISVPPLASAGDLKIPNAPNALKVPDAKPNAEELGFAYQIPDPARPGKRKAVCLDEPPAMPPSSDATK